MNRLWSVLIAAALILILASAAAADGSAVLQDEYMALAGEWQYRYYSESNRCVIYTGFEEWMANLPDEYPERYEDREYHCLLATDGDSLYLLIGYYKGSIDVYEVLVSADGRAILLGKSSVGYYLTR